MTPITTSRRRVSARRFSCAHDTGWERLQRAVVGAGIAAVGAAVLPHIGVPAEVLGGGWALLPVLGGAALGALTPVRARAAEVLRWDGAQWWWERPGEPLANEARPVVPEVFIDTEQWMLLRLRRADEGRANGRVLRWLAVSRRGIGAAWTPLRLHLFLTPG
ncbi:hypothetical protein CDN99_18140 [Roseateles aquatilis]|uniref:Toxin CptA n=1 Tax=Roseateles aquatilis TaxID=431061 RepID=A0A246J4Z3_9BURK|nr:hypothetical protein [Roseateles aquatilis]OWQ87522.1 hypothetical protein CDN99_18140 [Roseateles aquatilis]